MQINFVGMKKETENQSLVCVGAKGFEPSTPCSQNRCIKRSF